MDSTMLRGSTVPTEVAASIGVKMKYGRGDTHVTS
jgi:hypothetical protein